MEKKLIIIIIRSMFDESLNYYYDEYERRPK